MEKLDYKLTVLGTFSKLNKKLNRLLKHMRMLNVNDTSAHSNPVTIFFVLFESIKIKCMVMLF